MDGIGPRMDARRVFNCDPKRFSISDQSKHVEPMAGLVPRKSFALSVNSGSDACLLAGKPADDDIDRSNVIGAQPPHIFMGRNIGPVLRENLPAKRVNLAEGHSLEAASPLQAKAETTNAGKEVECAKWRHGITAPHYEESGSRFQPRE